MGVPRQEANRLLRRPRAGCAGVVYFGISHGEVARHERKVSCQVRRPCPPWCCFCLAGIHRLMALLARLARFPRACFPSASNTQNVAEREGEHAACLRQIDSWQLDKIPTVVGTAMPELSMPTPACILSIRARTVILRSACLIGYMESIAIGKNLAATNGYEIEACAVQHDTTFAGQSDTQTSNATIILSRTTRLLLHVQLGLKPKACRSQRANL